MPNKYYSEISALAHALIEHAIPFQLCKLWGGWQIRGEGWDVICHEFSYGSEHGYLEACGNIVPNTVGDEVEGWLTHDEVLSRLGLIDHSDNETEDNEDYDDCDYDTGYDPYMGCFSDDC